jgi:hypothetical protein
VEDPVEYRIEKIRQVQLNRKAGMTFASGLRSILRQDPDVIMVGEIRDSETANIAVQAALTGHRVLSTLHTNDAPGAITRFVDMGVEPFLVASVMIVAFAQRLVRTVCPSCKAPYKPPAEALKFWGLDNVQNANFQQGQGCFNCMHTGYKGRSGVYEVMLIPRNCPGCSRGRWLQHTERKCGRESHPGYYVTGRSGFGGDGLIGEEAFRCFLAVFQNYPLPVTSMTRYSILDPRCWIIEYQKLHYVQKFIEYRISSRAGHRARR